MLTVCFAGLPSAGKSTTINEFCAVDLPGVCDADDKKGSEKQHWDYWSLIEGALIAKLDARCRFFARC